MPAAHDMHPLWYLVASGLIALVPIVIGVATSYLKVSIALGMLRSGFGAQQVPSGLVVLVLSLAITCFIMQPVVSEMQNRVGAVTLPAPEKAPALALIEQAAPILEPWREFLAKHAGAREVEALRQIALEREAPESPPSAPIDAPAPLSQLLLAFILSELKQGLAMGFVLLLPFMVIDLIVANILAGMGMYMVSPAMVSLPLKLVLFVVADGWLVITRGLILSYGG